jgi:hypothetical protein
MSRGDESLMHENAALSIIIPSKERILVQILQIGPERWNGHPEWCYEITLDNGHQYTLLIGEQERAVYAWGVVPTIVYGVAPLGRCDTRDEAIEAAAAWTVQYDAGMERYTASERG